MYKVLRYVAEDGRCPFDAWLNALKNLRGKAKILVRIDRLAFGGFGSAKALRGGVSELRVDSGPGYRIYFATVGKQVVLLLCGGDKSRQNEDIATAESLLAEYKRRILRRSQ